MRCTKYERHTIRKHATRIRRPSASALRRPGRRHRGCPNQVHPGGCRKSGGGLAWTVRSGPLCRRAVLEVGGGSLWRGVRVPISRVFAVFAQFAQRGAQGPHQTPCRMSARQTKRLLWPLPVETCWPVSPLSPLDGGGSIFGASDHVTVRPARFLCAQVSEGGGLCHPPQK